MYKSFQILNPFKAKKTWSETGVENVSRYGGDSKKKFGVVYEKMGVRMHPQNNRNFMIFRTSCPQICPQKIRFKKSLKLV
jgi:hypothetical protein